MTYKKELLKTFSPTLQNWWGKVSFRLKYTAHLPCLYAKPHVLCGLTYIKYSLKTFFLLFFLYLCCPKEHYNFVYMSLKRLLPLLLLLMTRTANAADTVTDFILDTVDSGEGSWPCLFYELNYNSDISPAEKAKWYALDEDESYWREGIGPFSIDQNKFLVTQWQSTVHPILIRRHFTLTEEDLQKIEIGIVNLTYSYDENPIFWLNGIRLTSATGWNDNNYATFRLPNIRKKLLVKFDVSNTAELTSTAKDMGLV